MADSRTIPLQLLITANDAASPEIQRLTSALDTLGIETQVIADGMAESERQAVGAFGAIADSARSTGEMIERGLVAALGRIESPQGVADLQAELQRLQQSGRLSGAELERLADAQQQLDRLAYAAGQSEAALSQELQRQRIAAQDAADAADGLGDASGRSTKAFVDHRKESGALGDALSNVADQFGLSGEAFDALTGQLAKGAAIAALATSFVNANREADLLEQQFRAMTGDATTAATEIDFLKDVANRWGVAIKDLAPAYLRLSAATKGSTAEGEKTRQMIDDLTAAYMNAGAGVDDLEEVMEILGETFSEGRVSIDDIKEGMQEDMPPAIQAATTAVLENNEALKKMLESGDAATEDFMPAFAAALREHIGGSATQIDSVSASLTRTVAALNELYVKVDSIVPLMAIFDGATKSVIKTFETVIGGASMLVDGFALVGNAVGAAAGALATGEDAIAAVTDEAERSGASIEKTALHLIGLKTASEEAAIRQEQMKKELQALREETDPYGAALEALNKKLEDAVKAFEKTGDAVKLTQTALQDFFAAPAQNLNVDGVLKLAAALKTVGTQAEDSGQQISDTLGQELAKLSSEQLAELERQARSAMAAASTGSETSRVAFAELGQVVEGVVLARLQRLGVDGPEALRGISTEANDAIDDFMALASNADLSAETIKDAFTGALAKLDNPEELDAFQVNIEELGEAGVLTGEQVAQALLQIRQRMQEVAADPAFAALNQALADLREETERGIETGQRERESLQGRIQSAIELAKAKGDEAEAARLSALATKEEVDQAEQRIQQLQRQQTEIDAHIQRQYAAANADGVYTTEERKVIEALKDKSVAIGDEIQKIEAKLPLQQREADDAARAAGPIGQLTRLYKKQADEHQRAAQVANAYTDVQLKEIEGSIRVAKAKGDEAAAAELQAKQQRVLIEQAEQIASQRAQEATDAEKAVTAKTLELVADGELSKADREQIANLETVAATKRAASIEAANHANAMRAEANAGAELATVWENTEQRAQRMAKSAEAATQAAKEQAVAAASTIDSFYNSAISQLSKIGDKAVDAFRRMRGEAVSSGDDLDALAQHIAQVEQNLASSRTGQDRFTAWLQQIAVDTLTVEKAFLGQAQAAESLTERLEQVGNGAAISAGGMEQLIRQAQVSKDGFDLLDDTRLSKLQSAIDAANDKLREMHDITQSARERLAELNAEILEEQGMDQKAALLRQQIDYEQQLKEIEQQRSEAQTAGNNELLRILSEQENKLRTLNDLKVQNIQADNAANDATEKTRSSISALADEAERAGRAIKTLGGLQLNPTLVQQSSDLANHFNRLNGAL